MHAYFSERDGKGVIMLQEYVKWWTGTYKVASNNLKTLPNLAYRI
jgi:hypothetical protein